MIALSPIAWGLVVVVAASGWCLWWRERRRAKAVALVAARWAFSCGWAVECLEPGSVVTLDQAAGADAFAAGRAARRERRGATYALPGPWDVDGT